MPPEHVVRAAHETDLAAAAILAAELVKQHHAVDPDRFFQANDLERGYLHWFSRELKREEAVLLVAERGAEIVGYCYGSIEERDWNLLLDEHGAIHDLFVLESARRSGIGKQLLEAMIDRLEKKGAPRIVLSTMVTNEGAQRVFRASGFRPTMMEMTR